MGDACSRKNAPATLIAKLQADGRDIFSEVERVGQMDGEQRAYYEKFMADTFGISSKKKGTSNWDIMSKKVKPGEAPKNAVDDRLYINPSEQFKGKFWNSIDKKLTAWNKGKDTSRESYNENIGKPVNSLLKAIDKAVAESNSQAQLNTKLIKFGLKSSNVYDARSYLDWLSKGGHLKSQGEAHALLKTGGVVSKAQAAWNFVWTLGNGVDMTRVASDYLTREKGLENTIKGLYEAAKATKMNPFRHIPELKKQGVYNSVYMDRGGRNHNIFEWSITAQKNMTWHLDKAAGGDGHTGIRELLFDSKPWDRPMYDRFEGSGLIAGLVRYPINETRWLFKTTTQALSGNGREAAKLGVYFLTRAAFTGTASLVPDFVWQAVPKDIKKHVSDFEEKYNLNLIKVVSRKAFKAIGIKAEFDLTDYLQPRVPVMGYRAQSLGQTAKRVGKSSAKAVVNLTQGKLPAAGVNAAAAIMALANLGLLKSSAGQLGKIKPLQQVAGKIENAAGALEESDFNNTTVTELFDTTAKWLGEEFKNKDYGLNLTKAVFGQNNVKKAK
jgi:hypothetical protein